MKAWLSPHFCTVGDHPPSPVTPIQTFMSPVSNEPMGDIPNGYHQCFSDVFLGMVIFPFLATLTPRDPYEGVALLNGAFGDTTMGPSPFLGPNHNPEKRASSIRSNDPVLGQDLNG